MSSKVPKIHIDPNRILKNDIDKVLMSKYDIFFRRIVEFILERIEGTVETKDELLANKRDIKEMCNFINATSLNFLSINGLYKALAEKDRNNNYPETCDLIKQINKQL